MNTISCGECKGKGTKGHRGMGRFQCPTCLGSGKVGVLKLALLDPGDRSVGIEPLRTEVSLIVPRVGIFEDPEQVGFLYADLKKVLRGYIDHTEGAVLSEGEEQTLKEAEALDDAYLASLEELETKGD